MPNKIINQINLKNSDGQSSELYDIGADAVNVMYDSTTNIKTKIDDKADTQAVGQSIQQIRNVIPSTATSSNQLATANDVATKLDKSGGTVTGALTVNTGLTLGNTDQVTGIIFSTTDLTPGSSNLATDTLYFVYV